MLRDEYFELGHELAGSPKGEVRVETPLERGEAELAQPGDLRGDGVLMEYVRERSIPPQSKRSSKELGGAGGFLLEQYRGGMSEAFEPLRVESVGIDTKGVAARTRFQHGHGILRPAGLEDRP